MGERQDGDHAVISISFNEVMPRDGRRVDVVLPEWTDKRLHAWCDRDREIKGKQKERIREITLL